MRRIQRGRHCIRTVESNKSRGQHNGEHGTEGGITPVGDHAHHPVARNRHHAQARASSSAPHDRVHSEG